MASDTAVKPAIPTYFLYLGRAFQIVARTEGDDFVERANASMLAAPDTGLLHADDERQFAIVARLDDKGRALGTLGRVVSLECCCCGGGLKGRQWHNRDDGYGLCPNCIDYCAEREPTVEAFERCYGLRGIHFDISGGAA